MKRRTVIKNLVVVAGGLIALPSWAGNWNRITIPAAATFLSAKGEALLTDIVATIIPATDTPGAKELGVDALIKKILADCYEEEVRQDFAKGLEAVDALSVKSFGKPFSEASPQQRLSLLTQLEQEERAASKPEPQNGGSKPSFFRLVKELTILGYTNSEYVMTQLTGYVAVPGHYHGCVPYQPKKTF